MTPRDLLVDSFRAALTAADPLVIVPSHLPEPPQGRTLVVGAGKAAASMAKAVEDHWPAGKSLEGLVITRYAQGYSGNEALKRIRVIEAGHPVPDQAGEQAAKEIFAKARSLFEHDLLLVLVSGGGSSLLALPAEGIPMADLKTVTRDLLACGAPIQEMNIVRKHISLIQGGRLAALTKAKVSALIISDVTGDDPSAIASGPTAPDESTYQDALDILHSYRLTPPFVHRPAPFQRRARRNCGNPETGRCRVCARGQSRHRDRPRQPVDGGRLFPATRHHPDDSWRQRHR